jgi:hypothetical protein
MRHWYALPSSVQRRNKPLSGPKSLFVSTETSKSPKSRSVSNSPPFKRGSCPPMIAPSRASQCPPLVKLLALLCGLFAGGLPAVQSAAIEQRFPVALRRGAEAGATECGEARSDRATRVASGAGCRSGRDWGIMGKQGE